MQQIIQYISDNLAAIILIWQSLFIALSGACELFGWTKLSKFFGTTAALDLGRVLRYLRLIIEFAYASKKAQTAKSIAKCSLVVSLLALSGCSFLRSPTFWDGIEKTCEVSIALTPEAKARALATGTPVESVAELVCGIADVLEPFVREESEKRAGRKLAVPAVRQAVEIAKGKGVL